MAICGANGAGKSSLLRLIYRDHRPRKGQVLMFGRDLQDMARPAVARKLAVVLQEQPTDFSLSVRQIVALGRLPHRCGWASALAATSLDDEGTIDKALALMDLSKLCYRSFDTLSGGERQRVMVARALAQQPQVIVLDEPTNHLDIRHQLELLSLLRGLGLTVITTLHDLSLAAEFAERVLVLAAGRVLADGRPEDALSEHVLERAFNVRTRIDRTGPTPRFAFHL
jgi:iron complex transport system ATP-binding protein